MRIKDTSSGIQLRRQSGKVNRELAENSNKLASGKRIVKAADDAAGLSISSKVKAKTHSKEQAARNAQDSIGILQVMEGTLSSMAEMIIRLRELAIAAASDTYSDDERTMMNSEATGLVHEMRRIAQSTEYLDHKLLVGEEKKLDIQVDVGNQQKDRITLSLTDMAQTPFALGINDVKINTQLRASLSLNKLDYALRNISQSRAKLGGLQQRITKSISNLGINIENSKSANSRIKDVDYAKASATQVSKTIQQEAQTSLQSQVNYQASAYLKLL